MSGLGDTRTTVEGARASGWLPRARAGLRAVVVTLSLLGAVLSQAEAQQAPAAPGGWAAGTDVQRPAQPDVPTLRPGQGDRAQNQGELAVMALLSDEGQQRIEQGLVWRAYAVPASDAPVGTKPKLAGTWREPAPTVRLAAGEYIVLASFGRAHLSRRVTVVAGKRSEERFVLNAGGLRVTALLASGEKAPEVAVSYDVLAGEADQSGSRAKIVGGVKPGVIVRLNSGIYHIVSTWGDANASVRADVTVEAGKLSEATVTHHGAKVTLKLVTRAGGEALADTQWSLATEQGELVRESFGALPSHILANGRYVVSARNGGRTFKRDFAIETGEPREIEVVIP